MRIKMRRLASFLGFAVGLFILADLFIFSSVGRHGARVRPADDPYDVEDGRYIRRQIKSGKDYVSSGLPTGSDGGAGRGYEGVRDSVLGAMEVPGMRQKILPSDGAVPDELLSLERLERDVMEGRLPEEDEQVQRTAVEEHLADETLEASTAMVEPKDEGVSSEGGQQSSFWSNLFGLGRKEYPETDREMSILEQSEDKELDNPDTGSLNLGTNWNINDMDAAGMDSRVLSKLSLVQQDQLFEKKPTEAPPSELAAPPSEQALSDDWMASELKQIKGLAESLGQWQDEAAQYEPPAPAVPTTLSPTGRPDDLAARDQSPGAIQGFLSSLFQPMMFAGSTGDDADDDGGWASVEELDNLADKVNQVMVPGMRQKLVPQETAAAVEETKLQAPSPDVDNKSSDAALKLSMVQIPGFETDFFDKFGELGQEQAQRPTLPPTQDDVDKQVSEWLDSGGLPADFINKLFQANIAPVEVSPAVPAQAAAAAQPAAEGGQPDRLQVPSVPGLTDGFFEKYSKLNDIYKAADDQPPDTSERPEVDVDGALASAGDIKVPNVPGLSDEFFDKYGGRLDEAEDLVIRDPESLHVPNIPGLTDDFFNKYGVVKPSEQTPDVDSPEGALDAGQAEIPTISPDFFEKFIHPVAQGQAQPEVIVDSLQGVPGLPADFFDKFMKDQGVEDVEELAAQGLDIADLPGIEDYFNKYIEDSDLLPGEETPFLSLQESLKQAQLKVPGMPEKVMPEDSTGLMSELPDVPPSEYPEMDDDRPQSGVLSYLMSKFLGAKKQELGEGLPVLPSGYNISMSEETPAEQPEWQKEETTNQTEEGFRVRYPTEDEIDVSKVLEALLPNASRTNESLGLADARDFLSQLEGVIPGTPAVEGATNMSEKLANITSLEDSRIVECNLTKSPYWKVAITDRWHTVEDGLMFVYSAYMDDRILGHTAIRILGILEGWEVGMHLKPYCQVWFQDKAKPFVVGATYEWLPGQPIAKFKAVLLTCVYQTRRVDGKPLAVSLTTSACEQPKFLVKIHTRNETVGVKRTNFTVCLTGPMKFGYADVGQFIQWMEFNIMMGVERFVLYNHSMDAALRPYLVHYARLGYVQLFPWIIPENIPNPLVFLKNLGHLAMINDCLYRNMWTSRYVIFMDVDEMILPRYGHVTFEPMLRNAGCHRKPQAVVQSVFFRREWPNDELFSGNQTVVGMGLVGLLKTKRERKIWPPYMRSKYFIKPDEVLICNVHAAHSFLSPLDYHDLSCIFNPKEVILHHYRYWGEVTGNYVVDRRLHEYADELITRAASIYEAVLGRSVA